MNDELDKSPTVKKNAATTQPDWTKVVINCLSNCWRVLPCVFDCLKARAVCLTSNQSTTGSNFIIVCEIERRRNQSFVFVVVAISS